MEMRDRKFGSPNWSGDSEDDKGGALKLGRWPEDEEEALTQVIFGKYATIQQGGRRDKFLRSWLQMGYPARNEPGVRPGGQREREAKTDGRALEVNSYRNSAFMESDGEEDEEDSPEEAEEPEDVEVEGFVDINGELVRRVGRVNIKGDSVEGQ